MVEIVGGGSVINGATPSSCNILIIFLLLRPSSVARITAIVMVNIRTCCAPGHHIQVSKKVPSFLIVTQMQIVISWIS